MTKTAKTGHGGVGGETIIPLHQEELHVATRTVDTGSGVRLHKSVKEAPFTVAETLLHDELEVSRVVIDKIVAPAEAPVSRYEGDTLIVPVLEEILVVEKRIRIKEEIHVARTRRATAYSETMHLKTEELAIERFGGAPAPPEPEGSA
ncbi:MAG TPA: YsnF/AvaK domain-containing protein [Janthinobacterium sp.]|jgi:uncharacterized protein (TIGR02271 family)|nr:YsnF/AvaK domain-containing protein [Janthinobacterium sp.]